MFSFAFQVQTIIPNDNQSSLVHVMQMSFIVTYTAVEVEMESVFRVFLTSAVNFTL